MKCSYCGKDLPNDAKFCHICGTPIEEVSEKKEDKLAYYKSDGTLGYKDKSEMNCTFQNIVTESKCTYCGTELSSGAKFCPNCAEPIYSQKKTSSKISTFESEKRRMTVSFTLGIGFMFGFTSWLVLVMTDAKNKWFLPLILFFVGSVLGILIGVAFIDSKAGEKRVKINSQFKNDKTSICPMCGSHSIKIYRKGYNWNEAFWGSMFNIKGSRYTAGMDSNNAMCHCQHCGHNWNSGYDYRKIK